MTGPARYRIADGVAWVDSVEGQSPAVGAATPADVRTEAWLAVVPDGAPLSLNGSGLAIWLACVECDGAYGDACGDACDGAGYGGAAAARAGYDGAAPATDTRADAPAGVDPSASVPRASGSFTVDDVVAEVRAATGNPEVPTVDVAAFMDRLAATGLLLRVC